MVDGSLDAIMMASGGDMRKAVTFLQSSHQLSGGDPVTAATVIDISAQVRTSFSYLYQFIVLFICTLYFSFRKVPPSVVSDLWVKMTSCSRLDVVRFAVSDIIAEGYPMSAILMQLHDDVITKEGLSDVNKALICEKLAQVCNIYISSLILQEAITLTRNSCVFFYFAQADQCLIDGACEALQLFDVAAYITRRLNEIHSDSESLATNH